MRGKRFCLHVLVFLVRVVLWSQYLGEEEGMLICGEFQFMFMSGEPDKREESVQENMTSQRMKRERFNRVKV